MRNFWIAFGISCVCDAANVIIPGIPVIIHVIYNIAYLAPQYNKLYTKFLVRKGYRAASDADVQALRSKGYPVGEFAAAETNEEWIQKENGDRYRSLFCYSEIDVFCYKL